MIEFQLHMTDHKSVQLLCVLCGTASGVNRRKRTSQIAQIAQQLRISVARPQLSDPGRLSHHSEHDLAVSLGSPDQCRIAEHSQCQILMDNY